MKQEGVKQTLVQKLYTKEIEDDQKSEITKKVVEEPKVHEVKAKKPQVKRVVLRNENLLNIEKGLWALYNTKPKDRENPEDFIQGMLETVQKWTSEMMPRYDFPYLLERIQALGKKEEVATFMSKLRAVHIGEITAEEFKELYKTDTERLKELESFQTNLVYKPTEKPIRMEKQQPVVIPQVLRDTSPIEFN